jgi:hypothetical protein
MSPPILRFDGSISGARFTSGDTIVVGAWRSSPFGPFADVMWARRDGRRALFAGDERVLGFVGTHYRFDERRQVEARVRVSSSRLCASAGPLSLEMTFGERRGLASRLLGLRPERVRTWRAWIAVEDAALRPLLAPLLGSSHSVRTRGRTAGGAREWYAIHDYRPALKARATLDGAALGPVTDDVPAAGFGFSEFPGRPGTTRVTSLIAADDRSVAWEITP